MKKLTLTLMALAMLWHFAVAQKRYTDQIFTQVDKISNVVYGTAPFLNTPYHNENSLTVKNLVMDIFQPAGDDLSQRPAIIFAHGGGFATGNRSVDDMLAFCDSFAKKGYVTASIDYRQGVEVADNADLHYSRSAYRGLQDGRTAVRFLRAQAAEYGIDPEKIYWGGNSAGSVIGLSAIYLDLNEKPEYTSAVNYNVGIIPFSGPDLGPFDMGENMQYNGKPDAVMSCWGGISNPQIIQKSDATPVFLVHGTADMIVPFNSGSPFGLSSVSAIYGSNRIYQRLNELEVAPYPPYFVEGEGHEFYGVFNGNWLNGSSGNNYWTIVVGKATDFFWQQHKPQANYSFEPDALDCRFTDLSEDAISWWWDFGDGQSSHEQNPEHQYAEKGTYLVTLYIENQIRSWDQYSNEVSIEGTVSTTTLQTSKLRFYPNPVQNNLFIELGQNSKYLSVYLYDQSGQLLFKKEIQDQSKLQIDLDQFASGIFIIRLNTLKTVESFKLMKK